MVWDISDNSMESDVMAFVPSLGVEIKTAVVDIGSSFVVFLGKFTEIKFINHCCDNLLVLCSCCVEVGCMEFEMYGR